MVSFAVMEETTKAREEPTPFQEQILHQFSDLVKSEGICCLSLRRIFFRIFYIQKWIFCQNVLFSRPNKTKLDWSPDQE